MVLVDVKTSLSTKTLQNMRSLLYLIAVILVIGWIFGFFVYPVGGGLIHILLVIAVIAILLGIIRRA
jgi:hypothetical protein